MHQQIGRAVFFFRVRRQRQFVRENAAVPFAIGPGVRLERGGADAWLNPDAAQHPHRVRAHLDAGAKADETRRLLVDLGTDAALMQRGRKRESAHPGADNGKRGCHGCQNASQVRCGL